MSKEPGDWYGVNSIAQVIKSIFTVNQKTEHVIFEKLGFITF